MTMKDWDELGNLELKPFVVRPRYSQAGDCLFMYFTDEESWADRVDGVLTLYRTNDQKIVGFKLKNVTLLARQLGPFWVCFQTCQFKVVLLIRMILMQVVESVEPAALRKYSDALEAAEGIDTQLPATVCAQ